MQLKQKCGILKPLKTLRNTAMKVSTFLGFTQEKIEFVLNGRDLSNRGKELLLFFDLLPLGHFISFPASTGRPRSSRVSLLKAFIVKAALNITENKQLREVLSGNSELHKICGWTESKEIPSLPTFSRVFKEFAEMKVAENIHATLIKTALKDSLIGHVSRDASSITAREKPIKKAKKIKKKPGKRGRPKKGTPLKKKELTRIQKQMNLELDGMMKDIPTACDYGYKIGSNGNPLYWIGYKLHTDWSDEGIPLSYIVTSASLHDSQVSIPLTAISSRKATYLYELMDAGYDAPEIDEICRKYNHIPIIKPNKRRSKNPRTLDPAERRRYRERTTAERGFAALKDDFRIDKSRFRGNDKIASHIGFSMIVLTLRKLLQYSKKFPFVEQTIKEVA